MDVDLRSKALAFVMAVTASVHAGRVCDLVFSECPRAFSGTVIKVPPEFIRLDARIPYCDEYVRLANAAKPPSIVFIIDNSGSMDENDPQAARFDVVASLLDEIRSAQPDAAVGLVVFTRRLAFDHRDNPYFKTAFPGDTTQHDSFAPLTPLDKIFPDGRTGLDTLKALLSHDPKGNLIYATRRPASRGNPVIDRRDLRNGTDITLGFMAAKLAMGDSKSDSSGRFFVFLSDGTPSTPDYGREASVDAFIDGAGVPATFTVFFDTQNSIPVAPATIVQMTANIRANGYSSANPQSGYWALNQPGMQLKQVLRDEVVGKVLSAPAQPKDLAMASGDTTLHAAARDGNGFVFSRGLNLRADTTRLSLDYSYTYIDSGDGPTAAKEETVPYVLTIVRTPGPTPAGTGGSCRDQAQVGLYRDGRPVSAVNVDDARLEARLIPPAGLDCRDCHVEVAAVGRSPDREFLSLAPLSGYYTGVLPREESDRPVPGDGRLQNTPFDSIVVAYVNPENPLDRVRQAYPYFGAPTVLAIAYDSGLARIPYPAADDGAAAFATFVLTAPPDFRPAPRGPADRWRLEPASSPSLVATAEAGRYAGLTVTASRAFAFEMRVFSNLGEFVDKLEFSVSEDEFAKLPPGPTGHSRALRVLWDGRSQGGSPVATGAYLLKTAVRLMPIPGIAENKAERSDLRRIGVLRTP